MAPLPDGNGKESAGGTVEPDGATTSNDTVARAGSASMASKLAASASGLTRSLLGAGPASEDAASVLAPNGTAGKSQNPMSNGPSASSTWTDSSRASRPEATSLAYGSAFRTEARQERELEQDFAKFLDSQPVQHFESPQIIPQSYTAGITNEAIAPGQYPITEPAQRAWDILIANDVNPRVLTASQFQSFGELNPDGQRQFIRSYVESGNATWNFGSAKELDTDNNYQHPLNMQPVAQDHSKQSESVLAQSARNILIINDINPDLLTESQFLSFQRKDLDEQKQLIRTYFKNSNSGASGNGRVRQAVGETHASDVGQEQPGASQRQATHALEPHLQLRDPQDGPYIQQDYSQMNDDELKAASPELFSQKNMEIDLPAQEQTRAQQAAELLVANGINPGQLTASQFSLFEQQTLETQRKSVEIYLRNLAQHNRSIGRQEESYQQHLPLEEDGAAVVALLSQPNFLDLIDTSQDEEDLPSISSLNLTSSQVDTIERLKALLPAPQAHSPLPPTHPLNLIPIEVLAIPPSWDSRNADMSHADFADYANHRQQWLRDWDGVLRSYTDEVWGDLLPLVEEAREELGEARENDGELLTEGRAIRRLAMVLGHLRDEKISQSG